MVDCRNPQVAREPKNPTSPISFWNTLTARRGGNYGDDAFLDLKPGGKAIARLSVAQTTATGHCAYSFAPNIHGDAA
jgi:hypothetical protein